ncbi:MAG: transposase [Chloroflexi bacterium]|nr:transposase [Chloroflexota bacterium]
MKHSRKVRDEAGGEHRQTEYFYGYKQHVSLNAETGLITNVHHTPGNAYDGHELPRLIKKDLRKGVPVEVVAADRGYDDGENHEFLRQQGIASAIRLNGYRTKKKDPNKGGWLRLLESDAYRLGGKERYKAEQKFGEMKTRHGFRRCRYLGLARYAVQGYLTVMVVNLKRIVKLLAGQGFSGGPAFAIAGPR